MGLGARPPDDELDGRPSPLVLYEDLSEGFARETCARLTPLAVVELREAPRLPVGPAPGPTGSPGRYRVRLSEYHAEQRLQLLHELTRGGRPGFLGLSIPEARAAIDSPPVTLWEFDHDPAPLKHWSSSTTSGG